jgi:NAD(P)H-hydrate repair Nnr-like enzyme with NAD(P)H-hydrate dehydratase domain
MVTGLDDTAALPALCDGKSVIVIGPGLGRDEWAQQCLQHAVAAGLPLICDADALNLIASPSKDDQICICVGGNPGMATGGMGDVLAGLTGALVAQGLSLMEASALGVATHARAGDLAWERYGVGLTATDVANGLGVDL